MKPKLFQHILCRNSSLKGLIHWVIGLCSVAYLGWFTLRRILNGTLLAGGKAPVGKWDVLILVPVPCLQLKSRQSILVCFHRKLSPVSAEARCQVCRSIPRIFPPRMCRVVEDSLPYHCSRHLCSLLQFETIFQG